MVTTDVTQPITQASPTRLVRAVAVGGGHISAFLAGLLVATGAANFGIGLSRTGWDLAWAGAIVFGIVAALAALIWWGVEQVVRRVAEVAGRNRNAILDVAQHLDRLEAVRHHEELWPELARWHAELVAQLSAIRAEVRDARGGDGSAGRAAVVGMDPASVQALRQINERLNR